MLADAVARSAGGQIVWAPDGYGRSQGKIFFYGPSGTVGGMIELYRYLEAQLVVISAAAAATRRERRVHGRTWRNSFLLGAVGRLAHRLDARRAEAMETEENSRALVVVKTAVERKIERRWPELESSRYRASVARSAYEAGSHAAKHVDLGDRQAEAHLAGATRRSGMSDRRLWLEEPCPTCGAPSGLRCQTSRYRGKPMRVLHAARGWRHRSCPVCKAEPGELCRTPTGRRAAQPHTARLYPGRRELFAEQGVWEELERWGAVTALVRFSGGGGSQGQVAAVTLEDAKKRELARWSGGEGELPEALAAAVWGRYALFRGHPRISGVVMWNVRERLVVVAGERGGQKFDDVLIPKPLARATAAAVLRDTSPASGARAERDTSPAAGGGENAGSCAWCGGPLPDGLRPEAWYCSKRCRQAASRAR